MNFTVLMITVFTLLLLLYLFLIFPGRCSKKMRDPFCRCLVAHRGLHSKDHSVPENSMAAFKAAVDAGYGIEFDIRFTKDKQIVVFHDDSLDRVCGVKGNVEDYAFQELRKFKLCGTKEQIPLFTEVLSLVDGKVPLVIELKHGNKNAVLCTQALFILRSYRGDYCIESFHPLIVGWFRKHAPDVLRGQLSGPANEFKHLISPFFCYGLSRLLSNFYARPHFVAYKKTGKPFSVRLCEALGAMKFVWTVRPEDNTTKISEQNDAIIFEYYRP